MLNHSSKTVSIHGYAGDEPIVYVGGKDKKLVQTLRHSLTDHGFTVQKRLKELRPFPIIILLIEIKRYRSATRIDDLPTSFVFKHNNLDKIIDDLPKIIREHFIDLPKQ